MQSYLLWHFSFFHRHYIINSVLEPHLIKSVFIFVPGVIVNMNPDGTQAVRYLSGEEAQAMMLEMNLMMSQGGHQMQQIMAATTNLMNSIFNSIYFPQFSFFD